MIICTSICANYLPKAMALAESVKKVDSRIKFLVCLTEREVHQVAENFKSFDYIVLSKDIGFSNFDQFIFKHTIVEASTAVKGQLFRYMLDNFLDEDKFVYLDPDIIVYSEFSELNEVLERESIVLTPHMLKPGNIDMEISSLKHGAFNLGFLAIKRSEEANRFINWWAERLFFYCYDDIPAGLFTDQKWINLAPGFFNIYILKHFGYNYATWSLLTRNLTKEGENYMVEGQTLRFIHYSGIDSGSINWAINEWLGENNTSPFIQLYNDYKKTLKNFGQSILGKIPWSYGYYNSGEFIEKEVREMYKRGLYWELEHPYDLSNEIIKNMNAN
ncbi:glycosyltransferase [Bacillus suaedaesalsae]|uniref:Glycosyl transferase n=1 Tax=Bacillus suaedaesalsae TaxID=2810349 RepID=A0ABS2DIG6_9BACI|nr:glycosyltransferase [Bacillus suaedaesalsae]MBM6618239.1 hypothetical protein [Bacillus suaedaesalsae]